MSETITIEEINKNIRDIDKHIRNIKKSNENADHVTEKLRDEYARVKTGFLNGETPRLLALLAEGAHALEYLKHESKVMLKKLVYCRREHKRLQKLIKEAEMPTPKPVPLVEKELKRAKAKRKMIKLTTKETPLGWER